jgi:hypothetical protein
MIEITEHQVLHISELDVVRDIHGILQGVQTGAEIVIERDAQPNAVLRLAESPRRAISNCIALAKAQ